NRDRLRGRKANVVAKNGLDPLFAPVRAQAIAGVRALKKLGTAGRVDALQDLAVAGGINLAGEAEIGGQGADPLARGLTGLHVVVVAAFGDGGEPVARVAALDLGDADHRGDGDGEGAAPPEIGNPRSGS